MGIGIPVWKNTIPEAFTHMEAPGKVAIDQVPLQAVLQKSNLPVSNHRQGDECKVDVECIWPFVNHPLNDL